MWDLPNLDPAQSQLPDSPAGGALTISANDTDFDEDAQLTHVTSNNNTWNDPVGVSAHVNMEAAFTYYKTTHDRDAIDGRDQSIISIIHVTDGGQSMENAFWNGRVMAYGQIARLIPAPASIDPLAYRRIRARWVGYALAGCPDDVPWHRVVNQKGEVSPRADGKHQLQLALLRQEAPPMKNHRRLDMNQAAWEPSAEQIASLINLEEVA